MVGQAFCSHLYRAADWDSGDRGATPGLAMIDELCDLGKLISLDIRGMILKLHAVPNL